jgi:exonuclease VII small subunit
MKKNEMTIKEKIEQLDQLVAWFESDNFDVEEASSRLKEAAVLAEAIKTQLESVANDVQEVKESFAARE